MEQEWEETGDYSVIYPEVVKDTNFDPITRLLARQIMEVRYLSVGDYFQNLPDADLEAIIDMIEVDSEFEDGDLSPTARDIIMLTLMLSQAEGGATGDLDDLVLKVKAFKVLAVLTHLARNGMAEPNYENFSIQADAAMLPIASRIQDPDDED